MCNSDIKSDDRPVLEITDEMIDAGASYLVSSSLLAAAFLDGDADAFEISEGVLRACLQRRDVSYKALPKQPLGPHRKLEGCAVARDRSRQRSADRSGVISQKN